MHKAIATALAAVMIAGCANPVREAEDFAAQDEWMKAVIEYRKAVAKNPSDIEYRSRLRQTELKAADFYYQRGMRLLDQGQNDAAVAQFQQGLAAMSEHRKLQQAMNEALARKEAQALYQEALGDRTAGKNVDAIRQLRKALEVWPEYKDAAALLSELRKQEEEQLGDKLALSSKAPITLNFRQSDLRTAFEFLARSFGVNVIFDEAVKSVPVTLFARDVTFDQGLSLLLSTTRTFYKKIGQNSILIAPDTRDKRGQYEDYLVRVFQLNSVKAKDMSEILKGVINVKKMIVNEQLNTILVRDTEEVIRLAERIIEANDRKPAEIILEVEILEVDRNKAEKLGLDFGTYSTTASLPAPGTVPLAGPIGSTIRNTATLSIPSVTLRFFKQDVDAKTLANPRIRVLNGKAAKIHIGDRVPLRAATVQDVTGQVRTMYDYREIGIRLLVEPTIHLDNSATVKLGLEVSSLGENVGTAAEPAYRIGTRNAETYMLLRDGETAILGGLIRDEERNTKVRLPGLGDIPIVGSLFTSYDNSAGRSDVLLTITPRVVRGWDVPGKNAREFYSGTENVYSEKPLFAALEVAAQSAGNGTSAGAPLTAPGLPAPAGNAAAPGAAPTAGAPVLAFAEPVYEAAVGQEFQIPIVASNFSGVTNVPVEILYNPLLAGFVRGDPGAIAPESFGAEADAAGGVLSVKMQFAPNALPDSGTVLARVVMKGLRPGVSYLVYRTPSIRTAGGQTLDTQVRAARGVIR